MIVADSQAKVSAYTAAIDALFASDQAGHALVLAAELLALLEGGRWASRHVDDGASTAASSNPERAEPRPSCLVEAPAVATARPGRERTRAWRARLKAERSASQLSLTVRDVTPVTNVVTGDVTAVSLSSPSPERPFQGLAGEGETLSERRDAVTVTVTPGAEPDPACAAIFTTELARRPGVTLVLEDLWRKFQGHGYTFVSGSELRFKWRDWCRRERPERKAAAASVPVSAPQREVEKGEASPGVCSAAVDPEERSRRVARELLERREREEARLRAAHAAAWRDRVPDPAAAFTPEALGAASRRAS